MVNRAQRRKAERQQSSLDRAGMKQAAEQIRRDIDKHGIFDAKAALANPYYMQQVKARRVAQREQWVQNGITKADVDAAYKEGYAAARSDLVGHYQQFFYAAIAIALHRLYGFGETRIIRTLDDVQTIMSEEICSCDIIQRCRAETGLDILDDEYTS